MSRSHCRIHDAGNDFAVAGARDIMLAIVVVIGNAAAHGDHNVDGGGGREDKRARGFNV